MRTEDLNWLAGIIEGGGSFAINICMRDGGFSIYPVFRLAMPEKNKGAIYLIKDLLGVGKIEFKPRSRYVYAISGVEGAQKFIKTFDEKLFRTSKKRDFLLWKEAVKIIKDYRHLTYNGFVRICEIRDLMNRGQKGKKHKSKEWFLNFVKKEDKFFSRKNVAKRKKISTSIRRLNRLYPKD